ncbi:MAG: hypothetical protein KA116_03060 [Proteobacteria bacterium]|nr:hypothetical protein [Pseudomonadota bacterium]
MSLLARYKKNEKTFMELVKLVEGSTDEKKQTLLGNVRQEDPAFAAKVECRVLNPEDIKKFSEDILAEIVAVSSPKILATIIMGEKDEEFKTIVERCLGKKYADVKNEKESLDPSKITEGSLKSVYRKMIAEARKLEDSGRLKIPAKDPSEVAAAAFASGDQASGMMAKASAGPLPGSAKSDGDCPSIETFAMEPPPFGLSGERFEVFVKNLLK